MSALAVTDLRKTYANGVEALRGVSLTVEKGDFFALLGPNGAGKTTLIGIVAGLVNKTGGTVFVDGIDAEKEPERARTRIGLVPQEFNFSIFEKTEDIVLAQAGYYGLPRALARERAEKYLTALGLWEKRKEPSRTLSGGMKRRLMIARALVHEPPLLILDEPTAGVDIELRRGMWDFLREVNGKGTTIILTTHYLEEAEQLAKNVAIINKGDVIAQGTIRELLSQRSGESFVFDTAAPYPSEFPQKLAAFAPKSIDKDSLEVSLSGTQTLNEVLRIFDAAGVSVRSMRNKTNRLEELFLTLTKHA
ncbi:MAG TPA: ABC transporter ATP-binding protein [Candidatus Paceibacterota bacterium]|nr:ABC transporter ATP-binding protein [Candidatus Paceibacterota bacterium]